MHDSQDNDRDLFRAFVGEVKPLVNDRAEPDKPAPEPVPTQLELDEQRALEDLMSPRYDPERLNLGDEVQFHRPGLQHGVVRKLRRGQFSVADELDLHGMTAAEARSALAGFLKTALDRESRCVRIIHGKGRGSSNEGPVLKPLVARWLIRQEAVLAFTTARPIDGGTGALYVLLRK